MIVPYDMCYMPLLSDVYIYIYIYIYISWEYMRVYELATGKKIKWTCLQVHTDVGLYLYCHKLSGYKQKAASHGYWKSEFSLCYQYSVG